MIKYIAIILYLFTVSLTAQNKSYRNAVIKIDTTQGHSLKVGCSGFNVRIADKVWSYSHPSFKKVVHELKPGWLRYYSGTIGDAFNSATGSFDKDYAMMFDHSKSYLKAYKFAQVKGPYRIIDLYHLLGEVDGKLVVTVNAFTETPEVIKELASFCKNNNIKVEVWQFCNEPYFYVSSHKRYWWNNGYDYATKMKPYADAIRTVFPDAKLALNCTWDGIGKFFKEIYSYEKEKGAYWNVFSKHSYAPHVGGKEPFEKAYRRANTKIIEVTDENAMQQIENHTWKNVPMLITEFGVWNSPLNGIYSAIYNAEYTLRQLSHTNLLYIASHEISNKYTPAVNKNEEILKAYDEKRTINTDTIVTGIKKNDEGKALKLVHEVTDNSNYTWNTHLVGGAKVPGLDGKMLEGLYSRAFKGTDGFNYLLITNRSKEYHKCKVLFAGKALSGKVSRKYLYSKVAKNKNIAVLQDKVKINPLSVPPYSVVQVRWKTHRKVILNKLRIYEDEVTKQGISLHWWRSNESQGYEVVYGNEPSNLNQSVLVKGCNKDSLAINNLDLGKKYYFSVRAINKKLKGEFSDTISVAYKKPDTPTIFKTARRDTTITIMWKSVKNANGYLVHFKNGSKEVTYDAKNVFGYRVEGLNYDIPYKISVSAYNGLGEGANSAITQVSCKKHLPIIPRNISAKETIDGYVRLEWIAQDTINPHVRYRVYRGTKLHEFTPLADNITTNSYVDKKVNPNENYYYTVKSYNEDGECDFYPNIATVIKRDK